MAKASSRTLFTCLYLTAAMIVFLPAAPAAGEDAAGSEPTVMEDCSVPMKSSTSLSAMRVFIDPETGAIRQPTRSERDAFARRISVDSLLNRSTDGLVVEQKPDGAKFVHLQGRFMHALVVKRGEDGKLIGYCVDDAHQLEGERAKENRKEAAQLR